MTSWREDTPQAVQDDLDGLLGVALDAAQTFLAKSGEFVPFGVTQSDEGVALISGADASLGEHPSSLEVLALILEGLRADRDRLRCIAMVAPVTVEGGGDAIRVESEHRDGGPALVVLLPYRVGRFIKKVELGDLAASSGSRQVWTS